MTTKNLDQAADYLKVSADTMRDLADTGTVPGAKVGKQWVFRTADLDAYLSEVIARQTEERRQAMKLGERKHVPTAVAAVREKKCRQRRDMADLPRLPVAA